MELALCTNLQSRGQSRHMLEVPVLSEQVQLFTQLRRLRDENITGNLVTKAEMGKEFWISQGDQTIVIAGLAMTSFSPMGD